MEQKSQIFLPHISTSVQQDQIASYIETTFGQGCIKQMVALQAKTPIHSGKSLTYHLLITVNTPELAAKIVAQEKLIIGGCQIKVDLYKPNSDRTPEPSTTIRVTGFTNKQADEIRTLFEQIGPMKSFEKKPDGSYFISFENKESVDKAIAEYNTADVGGSTIGVAVVPTSPTSSLSTSDPTHLSASKTNIVLKGSALIFLQNDKSIRDFLAPYGITNLVVKPDTTAPNRRIAFISFETEESAEKAINELNNKPLPDAILPRNKDRAEADAAANNIVGPDAVERFLKIQNEPVTAEYVESAEERRAKQEHRTGAPTPAAAAAVPAATPFTQPQTGVFLSGRGGEYTRDSIEKIVRMYGTVQHCRFFGPQKAETGMVPWKCFVHMSTEKEAKAIIENINMRRFGEGVISAQPLLTREQRAEQHLRGATPGAVGSGMMPQSPYSPAPFGQGGFPGNPASFPGAPGPFGAGGMGHPGMQGMMPGQMAMMGTPHLRQFPMGAGGMNPYGQAGFGTAGPEGGMMPPYQGAGYAGYPPAPYGAMGAAPGMGTPQQYPMQPQPHAMGAFSADFAAQQGGMGFPADKMRRPPSQGGFDMGRGHSGPGRGRFQHMGQEGGRGGRPDMAGRGGPGRRPPQGGRYEQGGYQHPPHHMAAGGMPMAPMNPAIMHHPIMPTHPQPVGGAVPTASILPSPGQVHPGMGMPAQAPAPVPQQMPAPQGPQISIAPFDLNVLEGKSDEEKREMIGEYIYPYANQLYAEAGGKITGMLLELGTGKLREIIVNPVLLRNQLEEANNILHQ